jgi:L-2-aminoadipate N-acetyltransferase (EC 2.3.1.-)
VFYLQEYVAKPDRDVRVLAVDGEPVAAMTRTADHWLTNAAQGAETAPFALDSEAQALVRAASDAVGGGLLGVDLMETADGYTVHEVNHTVEFKALDQATDVDVSARVVDWLETRAEVAA